MATRVADPTTGPATTTAGALGLGVGQLRDVARVLRADILRTVHSAGSGHLGGSLSVADILAVLYFRELRIDPARPAWEDRDRFVLSKGHCAPALYAALARRGYLPPHELRTFDAIDSRLQMHPDMTVLPGLDMSTGSLGQGLSAAIGMALGARVRAKDYRVYAVLGDGESQEGQVWEAAMVAARYALDNLVAILDWNGLQQYGWRQPGEEASGRMNPLVDPAAKFHAFGWRAFEIDGHDIAGIIGALDRARTTSGRPSAIIARTIKGKGVSFMESNYVWHASEITDQQLAAALQEVEG